MNIRDLFLESFHVGQSAALIELWRWRDEKRYSNGQACMFQNLDDVKRNNSYKTFSSTHQVLILDTHHQIIDSTERFFAIKILPYGADTIFWFIVNWN